MQEQFQRNQGIFIRAHIALQIKNALENLGKMMQFLPTKVPLPGQMANGNEMES